MATEMEVRVELIDHYPGIVDDDFYEDYVRIGVFLSNGGKDERLASALKRLDDALIDQILANRDRSEFKGAITDRQGAKAVALGYYEAKRQRQFKDPLPRDGAFQHILTDVLARSEQEHGFRLSARMPIYADVIKSGVFLDALKKKEHWKDIGALAAHGEFTHRLQWYVITEAANERVIRRAEPKREVDVFAMLGNYPASKGSALWDLLCDRLGQTDKGDFRRPENFNQWLVFGGGQAVCPVLSAFLAARQNKRTVPSNSIYSSYLVKKTGLTEEQIRGQGAAIYTSDGSKYTPVKGSKGT